MIVSTAWAALAVVVGIAVPVHARAAEAAVARSRIESSEGAYWIVKIDPKRADLRLRWKDKDDRPLRTLEAAREAVRAEGRRFEFATNSGIYARDGSPLGLHVEQGRRLARLNLSKASKGNFFVQPNGVFYLKGRAAGILETKAYRDSGIAPDYASQSGPLLVQEGRVNPSFSPESDNRRLRSGVGVANDGRVVFAVSEAAVSFHRFATFFRDALACPNALYLDGTISAFAFRDEPSPQVAPFVGIWTASTAEGA